MVTESKKSGFSNEKPSYTNEIPLEGSITSKQESGYSTMVEYEKMLAKEEYAKRSILLIASSIFLVVQTLVVFTLIYLVVFLRSESAVKLQPLMATLVAGTLVQTYKILKIMVEYYFR